jgi:hypothetical protein
MKTALKLKIAPIQIYVGLLFYSVEYLKPSLNSCDYPLKVTTQASISSSHWFRFFV